MQIANLPLRSIVRNPLCQGRVGPLDQDHVDELRDAIRDSRPLPPVVVYCTYPDLMVETDEFILSEGFHRFEAFDAEAEEKIPCEIRAGSLEDAILNAMASNASHGLKRSKGDLKNAILRMFVLRGDWSDKRIAAHVQCSFGYVSACRRELPAATPIAAPTTCTDTQVELPQSEQPISKPVVRVGQDGRERAYTPKPVISEPEPISVHVPQPRPQVQSSPVLAGFDWSDWKKKFGSAIRFLDEAANGTGTSGSEGHREAMACCERLNTAIVKWRESINREARK